MRLALWRGGKDDASAAKASGRAVPSPTNAPIAKTVTPTTAAATESADLDLRVVGAALARKKGWIIIPTILAAALSMTAVNFVTPRYKSEARILIDGRENVFLRPSG